MGRWEGLMLSGNKQTWKWLGDMSNIPCQAVSSAELHVRVERGRTGT